ncbi:MAG: penicillin-insensitive murein endopeptidase [Candidatus Poribacteria bacterium]|nr:penicillin-insensitive murein endopeptidase [Candidatus Poribacteria bacterium]
MKRFCLLAAAALILSAVFPMRSRAQFQLAPSVSIVPRSQFQRAQSAGTSSTSRSYVMRPSLLPNGTGQREEKPLTVLAITNGLSLSQSVYVSIASEADDDSGGHVQSYHSERSGGSSIDLDGEVDPSSGEMRGEWITGWTVRWEFDFKFTSPEPSGTHTVTATVEGMTGSANISVQVEGLESLSTSSNVHWVGGTDQHPDKYSHYGTPDVNDALQTIANDWQEWFNGNDANGNPNAHPDDKFKGNDQLWVNDMSLPAGGLFDIRGNWKKSHSSHREGKDVDIWIWTYGHPGIPTGGVETTGRIGSGRDYLKEFWDVVKDHGRKAEYHNENHIHIDF